MARLTRCRPAAREAVGGRARRRAGCTSCSSRSSNGCAHRDRPGRPGRASGDAMPQPLSPSIRLRPPAIEDAQVQPAVERDLHAAGAARFERGARQVEPQVDAGDDARRHVRDRSPPRRRRAARRRDAPFMSNSSCSVCLASWSCGCALPARTNWIGCAPSAEQAHAALRETREQVQTLVGRHPAREADGQHVRVEDPGRRLDVLRRLAAREPIADRRARARTRRARGACVAADFPQLRVGDAIDRASRAPASSMRLTPVGTEMPVEQGLHRRRHPGRRRARRW